MTGRLVLAATPIGNVDDASLRVRAALESADVVAAEDTRRVRDLARRMGIEIGGTVLALHEHNERVRAVELIDKVRSGQTVVVVSDAGMPTVSDPGYALVRAAIDADIPLTTLPGPSAVLTALALSGLPTDRFVFEGFLPRKGGERSRAVRELASEPRTLVFFESPRRLAAFLADLAEGFGADRAGAICRELTKTHEEVVRGNLGELARWAASREVLGEIVVVVAGRPRLAASMDAMVTEVLERVASGERLKEAARAVAEAGGASSREVYAAALAARTPS